MEPGVELPLAGSLTSRLVRLRSRLAHNKLTAFASLAFILLVSLLAGHLIGDRVSVQQPKTLGGEAKQIAAPPAAPGPAQPLDPFARRPRIQTQNGHLVIQASQDKNIDFKTSGARGSISLNGFKLDQLLGVARALSQSSRRPDGANSSSYLLDAGGQEQQQHYELLVGSLLDSGAKLQQLDKANDGLAKRLAKLDKLVDKLAKRLSKRSEKLDKLRKRLDGIEIKLVENNCLDPDTGQPVCRNGAACLDQYDSFKCLCPEQWEGPTCELDVDECQKLRGTELGCQNGAKCVNLNGGYRCECPAQYRGVHCTELHDDCSLATSGAMCGHGKCVNVARSQPEQPAFECLCDQGWSQDPHSRACTIDVNECLAGQNVSAATLVGTATSEQQPSMAYPCSQNPFVECFNLPGSFQCGPCPPGYQGNGRVCRDVDECQVNNGGCSQAPLVECWNAPGSRYCGPCPPGYQGDGVECRRLPACELGGLNGGCHPMAKCVELAGVANADQARLCVCQYPFVGSGIGPTGCVSVANAVAGAAAAFGPSIGGGAPAPSEPAGLQALQGAALAANLSGQAVAGPLGELLAQMSNLTGGAIATGGPFHQDDCQPNPCLNGAECLRGEADFECLCPPDWTGRLCEQAADFACGGRLQASRGSFDFPLGGTFERLKAKLAAAAGSGRADSKQRGGNLKYRCTWSIAAPGNMSLKLAFSKLLARGPAGARPPDKRVQVDLFDSSAASGGGGRQASPLSCHESLDVSERLEEALEASGARGRLLARLCVVPGREPSSGWGQAKQEQGATLAADSNLVQLDYSFAAARPLDEPALGFHLNWSKTEPACGGSLPVQPSGSIASPRFPEFYPAGSECRWVLRVEPGRRVRIQFGELALLSAAAGSGGECADSLLILDGSLAGPDRPVLFRHCANQALAAAGSQVPAAIVSSSSSVEVALVSRPDSRSPLLRPKQKRGFYLTYASEPATPGCGGLYTAKSATIKSLDFERAPGSSTSDEALAFEFARYFDPPQEESPIGGASNYYASANSGWDQMPLAEHVGTFLGSLVRNSANNSATTELKASSKQTAAPAPAFGKYRTRCEYEIRPADQARNHRVQIDWLEMPSEASADSMGSLTRWSRRSRCMESRLMIFGANPATSASASAAAAGNSPATDRSATGWLRDSAASNATTNSEDASSSGQPLRTFCAGDRFNASLALAAPITSSGHALYLVYESINAPAGSEDLQPAAANTSDSGSIWLAGRKSAAPVSIAQVGGVRQPPRSLAGGFKLHYSTVCSAVYRQPEGQIITELDAEVDECLYHILLPPNNTISLLIEPLLPSAGQAETSGANPLNLPDGSCAAQAIFIDGVVGRGRLALAQTERQLRTYDFSGATFGASRQGDSGAGTGGQEGAGQEQAGFSFANAAPEGGELVDGAGGATQARATGDSAAAGEPKQQQQQQQQSDAGSRRHSYWQYGTSQAHDIKEFDVCKLPELGIDTVWNHLSLMFRLNPRLRSNSGASGQPGRLDKLRVLIKYQAESSCGGVISEPRRGSIRLVSARPVGVFTNYPLTVGRYEQLHRQLFVNQCAWILRNAPNQLIQLSFDQVPAKEIAQRRSDWIAWLRSRSSAAAAARGGAKGPSPSDSQTAPGQQVQPDEAKRRLDLLADCSQAFVELIEVYEPSANFTRFICPSELVDSQVRPIDLHWTTQSDTVFVRLINNTQLATPASHPNGSARSGSKSQPATSSGFANRKPLKGFPLTLNYKMLGARDSHCGGLLLQTSGLIQSPRHPFNYPTNLNCIWVIEAPSAEQQIRLNFSRFHLEESAQCWFDYLEIRNGPHAQSPLLGRFCGRDLQSRLLISQSHSLWLRFRTDSHLNRPGFRLDFDSAQTGCGGHLAGPSGQIDSPNYPNAYAQSADCQWTIEVAAGNRISLEFDDLDLSGSAQAGPLSQRLEEAKTGSAEAGGLKPQANCTNQAGLTLDYLEVLDPNQAEESRSLGRFCHLSQLAGSANRLHSSSNKLFLVYRSQAQDSGRGFRLRYRLNCSYELELAGLGGAIEWASSGGAPSLELCSWVLRAPLGSNLSIELTELGLFDAQDFTRTEGDEILLSSSLTYSDAFQRKPVAPVDPVGAQRAAACSSQYDRLNIWTTELGTRNATIVQQLEPLDKFKVRAFAKRQQQQQQQPAPAANSSKLLEVNGTTIGPYRLKLTRSFCGQLESATPESQPGGGLRVELASNLALIQLVGMGEGRAPRSFRLEWRARGCGGLRQQTAGENAFGPTGLYFDERLNLTQRQLSGPLECLWLLDLSRSSRLLELLIDSNMLLVPGQQSVGLQVPTREQLLNSPNSGACDEASLTLFDGADARTAPVLLRNCNERRNHESLYASSGQLLLRFFSSGRQARAGVPGRNFQLRAWPKGHYEGPGGGGPQQACLQSLFDISTPFLQLAGTQKSPNYPDLYEARPQRCAQLLNSASSGRLRLTLQELDIPFETGTGEGTAPVPVSADDGGQLMGAEACRKSGNYLKLRGVAESAHVDYLCGKFDRASGSASSSALARATFVPESSSVWLEFVSRGSARGRWRLDYHRLCGLAIDHLSQAEEFHTPNYPDRPQWPSSAASEGPARSQSVCVWRLGNELAAAAASGRWDSLATGGSQAELAKSSSKLHFNLLNFVESDRLASSPSDCLRVYEGANISLKTDTFNLTDLDLRLEPRLKICSLADLKFRSLYYVSLGSELTVLISGNAAAHFRVRPFENHCGAYLMLDQAEFASPNFPQPYGPDLDCHYFLFGTPGARIRLQFAEFDVGQQEAASGTPTQDTADAKCQTSDYVEVRQLSASQRFQFARKQLLKWQLSDRKNLATFLGRFAAPATNSTAGEGVLAGPTKQAGAGQAPGASRSRLQTLERLFELASVAHVFEETSESYQLRRSDRVRGQNQRLAIRLEEFYAASRLVGRFCGQRAPKLNAALLQDELLVRLRSHSGSLAPSEAAPEAPSGAKNARGFLANYKLEYGGRIVVEPQASDGASEGADGDQLARLNLLSSPAFPLAKRANSTISWLLETQSDHVIEFELLRLSLGPVHESCQDSLSIFDGLKPQTAPRLARLCGELSYRRLLDASMAKLWAQALAGSVSVRKLPVHLAHEPQVRANLIRLIRTTSNVASVVYENFRAPGSFLLRYRAVSKKQAANENALLDDDDKPLEADEALAGGELNDALLAAGATSGDKSCSRVYKLSRRALGPFGGDLRQLANLTANSTSAPERVEIMSPNWPRQVEQRELECHWLVRALDNTNIRLAIEPSEPMLLAAARDDQFDYAIARYAQEHCFKARERNFVMIFDGATSLAPLLGRYCLPVPPVQLQSSGRHLFIRYVHARPPELGADTGGRSLNELSSGTLGAAEDEQIERGQASIRTSLFKASASVGHCGGQYHVLFHQRLRDRPMDEEAASNGGQQAPANRNYENNLDCLYYVFASNPDNVLTLLGPTYSELELAAEPTNAACSLGDYIEVRDLPLAASAAADPNTPLQPTGAEGRLLGRYCAGHPLEAPLESPGSAISIRFHTDQAITARGFNLFLMASTVRLACPKTSLQLAPDEPYALLMSPNWPHGFTGKRRCKFVLVAPRNQTLELKFVRIQRPTAPGAAPAKCLDSIAYLDDNQAALVQFDEAPLKQLRTLDEGTLMRQLVQELACSASPTGAQRAGSLREIEKVLEERTEAANGGSQAAPRPSLGKLSARDYKRLLDQAPQGALTIRTLTHSLALEYAARNLLAHQGFLAVVRLAEMAPARACGGDVYPTPGRNKLESARFGQLMNESEPFVQCEWLLRSDTASLTDLEPSLAYANSAAYILDAPSTSLTPGAFKTSFIAFETLEIPPQVQNTSLFEEHFFGRLGAGPSGPDELCGLSRLTLSDPSEFNQLVACGYLSQLPTARWLAVNSALDTVRLRTRNLERVVYAKREQGATPELLEGRTRLFRGLRAFFWESRCLAAERLPGDTLRLRSHAAYNSGQLAATTNSSAQTGSPNQNPSSSYQPSICQWLLRLAPGRYELSLRSLNLRPPPASLTNVNASGSGCDLASEADYLELRESLQQDAPVLARFCAHNQLEAVKRKLDLGYQSYLVAEFVAGLGRLRAGQDKFADNFPPPASKQFGFELQLTRLASANLSDFCKRDSSFNIHQLVRNSERLHTYGDYYASALQPNALYAKNAHCELDLSLDSDLRFNLTFAGLFDLEPSARCEADYLELSDLFEPGDELTTSRPRPSSGGSGSSSSSSSSSKRPSGVRSPPRDVKKTVPAPASGLVARPIGRWCGRTLPKGHFVSQSNKIRLVFHSNAQIEGKGFLLDWSAVPANSTGISPDE